MRKLFLLLSAALAAVSIVSCDSKPEEGGKQKDGWYEVKPGLNKVSGQGVFNLTDNEVSTLLSSFTVEEIKCSDNLDVAEVYGVADKASGKALLFSFDMDDMVCTASCVGEQLRIVSQCHTWSFTDKEKSFEAILSTRSGSSYEMEFHYTLK